MDELQSLNTPETGATNPNSQLTKVSCNISHTNDGERVVRVVLFSDDPSSRKWSEAEIMSKDSRPDLTNNQSILFHVAEGLGFDPDAVLVAAVSTGKGVLDNGQG